VDDGPTLIAANTAAQEATVARNNHADHARVTAICVNLALDCVEEEIRQELDSADDLTAAALERVLAKVRQRRIYGDEIKTVGRC